MTLMRNFATQHGSAKPPSSKPPVSASSDLQMKADVPGLSSNCLITPAGGQCIFLELTSDTRLQNVIVKTSLDISRCTSHK